MSIAGYASWLAYDTFLIVSLSGRPIYDPNPLRSNPNPKKPVLGSCYVRGLGRTLTPLSMISRTLALLIGENHIFVPTFSLNSTLVPNFFFHNF